jgi:hypothetical protein
MFVDRKSTLLNLIQAELLPRAADGYQTLLARVVRVSGLDKEKASELSHLAVIITCSLLCSLITVIWDYMYLAIISMSYLTGSLFAFFIILLCKEE